MIIKRNMVSQVLLFIVTLGVYGIYWFYVTSKEIVDHKKMEGNPALGWIETGKQEGFYV